MITFGTLGLSLSTAVARALLAHASDDAGKPGLCAIGIDEGDVCATDGHSAVRFERCNVDEGAEPPHRWNRRVFARRKVEAALKAAGRSGAVVLLWDELEPPAIQFAQLGVVEATIAHEVREDDLPFAWDASLLSRIELVAKACRRDRQPGESATDDIRTPPAMLVSLGGHLDPCRYEIGGVHWETAQHAAFVTIMPMNMRTRGATRGDAQAVVDAKGRAEAVAQSKEAKAARRAAKEPGALPPAPEGSLVDERAEVELSRLSSVKLSEAWSGRDAQKQVLSNILRDRNATREQRAEIQRRMQGLPLRDLRHVVAAVLAAAEVAA